MVPRHPGKPDPRWRDFNWKFTKLKVPSEASPETQIATGALNAMPLGTQASGPAPSPTPLYPKEKIVKDTRMRLYFYDEEDWTARFVIPRLRKQVASLSREFNYAPSKEFSYMLFSTQQEFAQTNLFNISEGVQGVTSTTEQTMAIPYWGQTQTFDHISAHELAHQFQVQKVSDLAEYNTLQALSIFPLWFIEGMAEYYSLNGMDAESRFYIRDAYLNPSKKLDYRLPTFFEPQPLTFITVYKVGQAKINFLEAKFGKGTSQKILESVSKDGAIRYRTFESLVKAKLGKSPKQMEKLWRKHVKREYGGEAKTLSQNLKDFDTVEEAGKTLDLFEISPDGKLLVTREIDELTGVAALKLMRLGKGGKDADPVVVARDREPRLLNLFFMQAPTVAISDDKVAYLVGTSNGPEVETREIKREGSGELKLGIPRRARLHQWGLVHSSSPAISPDGKKLAFVGLTPEGRENVYVLNLDNLKSLPKQITQGYYSWRHLNWSPSGLIASSDRTSNGLYALFSLDAGSGEAKQLTRSQANQGWPEADPETGTILFQSFHAGGPQIHAAGSMGETRVTEAKTALQQPRIRGKNLYALGFRSGRFHLYRIPREKLLSKPIADAEAAGSVSFASRTTANAPTPAPATTSTTLSGDPWQAEIADVAPGAVEGYRPFRSSGIRLDNLMGFFSSGSVGGIAASVSDLMRNYSVSGELSVLGDLNYTNANLFVSSQRGRSTWTLGAYHILQSRLDSIFVADDLSRLYIHREYGGLGAIQYPFSAFSYIDLELRLGGVLRSDFNDPRLRDQWDRLNPGNELIVAPMIRYGYDRIQYEMFSGPLKGHGFIAETDTSYFPGRNSLSQRLRADAAYYWQATGRMVVAFQALAGTTFGGDFKNPFFLSSDDVLRAYPILDDRLRGNHIAAAKTELRFPIGSLFGFPPLRGLAAYDYGSVFNQKDQAVRNLSSSLTGGVTINLPPISLNLMSSRALRQAPGPENLNVFHFTFRYLYL